MKKNLLPLLLVLMLSALSLSVSAQQRRPIDSEHPLWLVHVDVWNSADPQKIIDLIPDDIKPFVCMNLSLSCSFDKDANLYKMPRCAMRTYKSWASVCQLNGLWFTCQPASGGHTHIQDYDLESFEYFFKNYPNFLGWNYAEQFWGFDVAGDKSSSSQTTRWALFAKLVEMSHRYGGFLTVSFCGNIWSHPLNPIGEMKRNKQLLEACKKYPEAILWLYKYTTSSCFYNNESVSFGPFISGMAKNYGVRYDNCGWNGAMDAILGEGHGKKYPVAAGIGTVMEQTCVNGGAVWDGPELIWTEDFQNLSNSNVDGYTRRNWGCFPGFKNIWLDMFHKIVDGSMRIPTREEVVQHTKIAIQNDVTSGSDEDKYATWGDLYDGLYKQTDPLNRSNGQWMNNLCYFKKTGRYYTIPMVIEMNDSLAKTIPTVVKKSQRSSRWGSQTTKVNEFKTAYPQQSSGDLFVSRVGNQLVTYTPYSYLNSKTSAKGVIPLQYNTCDKLTLIYNKLSSGLITEYADHIDLYLNNFRTDTTTSVMDSIIVTGVTAKPTVTLTKRASATGGKRETWDAETGTYTLEVKHNGPMDVTINCQGTAERTETPARHEALPMPKQPEAFRGPIVIEAENMDYKNVNVALTGQGWYAPQYNEFAGMGYVETNSASSLRHQLKLDEAGTYDIIVRYCKNSADGTLDITLNGEAYSVALPKADINDWQKVKLEGVSLKEGVNDLRINVKAAATIDQIIYMPAGMPAEKFLVSIRNAAHGSVTTDKPEAAEGETVTLMVNADEGWQLKELRVINSVYYTMAKTIAVVPGQNQVTFTMPDDNVTLQPVFSDSESTYKLTFDDVINGTIPEGWRCTQGGEGDEAIHEYPKTYSSGARTITGFTGFQGKGLYWREVKAEYGQQEAYPLSLEPGKYKLSFAMAAWKGTPQYQAQILNAAGSIVATTSSYTAAPNANGVSSANVSSAQTYSLDFTINNAGKYVISFKSAGGFSEYLLLACQLKKTGEVDGISSLAAGQHDGQTVYSLDGTRRPAISRGLNIVRSADGKTRKVMVK